MIAEAKSNLRFWSELEKTDRNYTKDFKRGGGFSGTDINPAYRMRRMTEMFGPCGQGWGWTIHERWREAFGDDDVVFVSVSLWYVDGGQRYETGQQIGGTVADRTPDESYKMAITDACGKCYLALGLAADVYMGEFDGKYHRARSARTRNGGEAAKPQAAKPPCPKCGKAEFVLQDRETPGKFFCWKNAEKNKLGCGYRWAVTEATAEKESPGAGESDPAVFADITNLIGRASTDELCDKTAAYIESKEKAGKLSKKDASNLANLLVRHQATLHTQEPQPAGAGF